MTTPKPTEMLRWFFSWLKLGVAVVALSAPRESVARNSEPELEANLIYDRVDERPLRLDLMVPTEGQGPYPVIMVIHGGAWAHGDKIEVRAQMYLFAKRGYATVAPQYRLAPEHPFPAALHDLKEAVRWVKANAKSQFLDAKHIGVHGQTAGAHLALMLGVTSEEDGLEKPKADANAEASTTSARSDSRVQAVVSCFGLTDLAADDFSPTSLRIISDFLNTNPSKNPELARKASPITYVTKDDPPILFFHNRNNVDIPFSQADKLKSAIEKAGAPGRLEMIADRNRSTRESEETRSNKLALDFFDEHLKPR